MVSGGEPKQSSSDQRQSDPVENGQNVDCLFSPTFKSLAAMAGWDEESIIVASLIVEDTPERLFKHKKRSDLPVKTPPSNTSRRKRRVERKSPIFISVPVIRLEEEEEEEEEKFEKQRNQEEKTRSKLEEWKEERKTQGDKLNTENSGVICSNSVLPCLDKLREELSCAICLEICFEPSTTSCGHSFCKNCLRSAAYKCGRKCPKCRQLISNGRSCTVNTVLWNTIQLLFPEEIEPRKAAWPLNSGEATRQTPETRIDTGMRSRAICHPAESVANARRRGVHSQDDNSWLLRRDVSGRTRTGTPSQDEDVALAFRLQREEFTEAFRGTHEQSGGNPLSLARANLRAMASRAIRIRSRSRPT